MSGTKLQVGATYDVAHSRKGKFRFCVTSVNGDFVTGTIVKGKAKMVSVEDVERGETLTFRTCLAEFTMIGGAA